MLGIIFGFLGVLAFFGMIGGIVYAVVNKKKPSATVVKTVISIIIVVFVGGGLWWFFGTSSTLAPSGVKSSDWSSPSLATVRDGIWSSWFWILIVCGIFLGAFSIWGGKHKSAQQTAVWGVAAMLFIVIPLLAWIVSPSVENSSRVTRSEIPLASSPQSEWPKLVIPAGGRSDMVPRPSGMHIVMAGTRFLHHAVYQNGEECSRGPSCPEGSVGSYARNHAKETNSVSYAYAPDK